MTTQERIQKVLGWTLDEYVHIVECVGYAWADYYFGPDLTDTLATSKMFWRWWVNEWNIREVDYLRETSLRYMDEELTGYALIVAREEWIEKHRVMNLRIKPNRFVYLDIKAMLLEERARLQRLKAEKEADSHRLAEKP